MNKKKYRVAFLCGDGGGDLLAINHAINYGLLDNIIIASVLTTKNSGLLSNKKFSNIPFMNYSIIKEAKEESFLLLLNKINKLELDIVFLAGFKYILPGYFINEACPIINSHHSLLPAFPGLFKKEEVVNSDVGIIGHTLHFVDEGVDTGKKIIQMAMPNFKIDGFEKILFLYRLGADIMNLQALLNISTEKQEMSSYAKHHTFGDLLFSEKIDQRIIDYVSDPVYKDLHDI
jgi:phosphoribosylglycinamide formyltransferase 1